MGLKMQETFTLAIVTYNNTTVIIQLFRHMDKLKTLSWIVCDLY